MAEQTKTKRKFLQKTASWSADTGRKMRTMMITGPQATIEKKKRSPLRNFAASRVVTPEKLHILTEAENVAANNTPNMITRAMAMRIAHESKCSPLAKMSPATNSPLHLLHSASDSSVNSGLENSFCDDFIDSSSRTSKGSMLLTFVDSPKIIHGKASSPVIIGRRGRVGSKATIQQSPVMRAETPSPQKRRRGDSTEEIIIAEQEIKNESPSKRAKRVSALRKGASAPNVHGIKPKVEAENTDANQNHENSAAPVPQLAIQIPAKENNGAKPYVQAVRPSTPGAKMSGLAKSLVHFSTLGSTSTTPHPLKLLFGLGENGEIQEDSKKMLNALVTSIKSNSDVEIIPPALVDLAIASRVTTGDENCTAIKMLSQIVSKQETAKNASAATLFRGTDAGPKLISYFLNEYSRQLIEEILKCRLQALMKTAIDENWENDAKWQVNPEVEPDEKKRHHNLLNLIAFTCNVLNALTTEAKASYPKEMHAVLAAVREEVEAKFGGMGRRAVGGFFFLRFANPVILDPAKINDMKGEVNAKTVKSVTKTCILMTKILQNLSNEVFFGEKEKGMEDLNVMIEQCLPGVRSFLDDLSKSNVETISNNPFVEQPGKAKLGKSMTTLLNFIHENRNAIFQELSQTDANAAASVTQLINSLEYFVLKKNKQKSPRKLFNAVASNSHKQVAKAKRWGSLRNLKPVQSSISLSQQD